MKPRTTAVSILVVLSGAAAGPGRVTAQIPDTFTNLKVLPKTITKPELVGTMRDIAGALGVRCNHCHVGPDNLQGMDFATDEKATKKTARLMLEMVGAINNRYLKGLDTGRGPALEVRCVTCHHGLPVPRTIEDVMRRRIESDGAEAALREYRELKDKHLGGFAYDFSEIPLNTLVEELTAAGKLDAALALARMNVADHPSKWSPLVILGGLHRARGERSEAVASFERALQIAPDNGWIKQQLEALKQPE